MFRNGYSAHYLSKLTKVHVLVSALKCILIVYIMFWQVVIERWISPFYCTVHLIQNLENESFTCICYDPLELNISDADCTYFLLSSVTRKLIKSYDQVMKENFCSRNIYWTITTPDFSASFFCYFFNHSTCIYVMFKYETWHKNK